MARLPVKRLANSDAPLAVKFVFLYEISVFCGLGIYLLSLVNLGGLVSGSALLFLGCVKFFLVWWARVVGFFVMAYLTLISMFFVIGYRDVNGLLSGNNWFGWSVVGLLFCMLAVVAMVNKKYRHLFS